MQNNNEIRTVDCCIVGGGPAGVVLGLLLARQGVEVALLEAHQDFDRDFRGDTVHPSTVTLLEHLGLLERLLEPLMSDVADRGHALAQRLSDDLRERFAGRRSGLSGLKSARLPVDS